MEPEFRKRVNAQNRRRREIAKRRRRRLAFLAMVALLIILLLTVALVRTVRLIKEKNAKAEEPIYSGETFTYWDTEFRADERKPKSRLNTALFTETDGVIEYLGMANTMQGIDVSSHNGDIDWKRVAADGIEFVMIRLGNRGATAGDLYEDERFEEYYEGAKAAGLKVGAYFFSQAMSKAEAKEEAQLALKILDGRKLDMPLAYDWEFYKTEEGSRTDDVTKETLTAVTEEFCSHIEKKGYKAMIYTNLYQTYMLLDVGKLAEYELWFAGYNENPALYYEFSLWQYSSSGTVDGIEGSVDRNLWFEIN